MHTLWIDFVSEWSALAWYVRILSVWGVVHGVQSAVQLLHKYLIHRSQKRFDARVKQLELEVRSVSAPMEFMHLLTKLDRLAHLADGKNQQLEVVRLTGYLHGRYQAFHPQQKKPNWKYFLTKELPQLSN